MTVEVYAGAWTLKRNQLWVKSSVFFQKTHEQFYSRNTGCPFSHKCDKSGQKVPFPFDGESKFTAVFLDIGYGLTDRLELKVQVPFYDIQFTDLSNPERDGTNDIGDIRFGARYRFITLPFVATFKVEAKAPTGFFNKEAEVIPIGDGQWDLELVGQFGRSLYPVTGYLNFDVGYRIRFEPDPQTSTRIPGNEIIFRGEGGFNVMNNLLLKLAVSGLYSAKFKDEDFTLPDSEREVLYLEPAVFWSVTPALALEAGVQFSLSGKNYPAGEVFSLGVSYTFFK
ncbi:MAG: transporter [bacterium]